jgi:hypothetical protein
MRVGNIEVFLKSGGVKLKEVIVDGKIFTTATEGQEYVIQVNVYRDTNGDFPFKAIIIDPLVDGERINDDRCFNLSKYANGLEFFSYTFEGYNYGQRALVFGAMSMGSNGDNFISDTLGSVTLNFYKAIEVFRSTPTHLNLIPVPRKITSIKENKKFFEAPSLSTSAGRQLNALVPTEVDSFDYVKPYLLEGTISLNYHSEEMIKCLQTIHAQKINQALVEVPMIATVIDAQNGVANDTKQHIHVIDNDDHNADNRSDAESDCSVHIVSGYKRKREIEVVDLYEGGASNGVNGSTGSGRAGIGERFVVDLME